MDFKNADITVRNKDDWHTKNYECRTIPINDFLDKVLRKHPRRINSKYVFCNPEGKPWDNVRISLSNAAKRAGIGHIGLHALRHTFASHLVMGGVDLAAVRKLLGHKDIKTTMLYAHFAPDHLKAAVEWLGYGHYMDTEVNLQQKSARTFSV